MNRKNDKNFPLSMVQINKTLLTMKNFNPAEILNSYTKVVSDIPKMIEAVNNFNPSEILNSYEKAVSDIPKMIEAVNNFNPSEILNFYEKATSDIPKMIEAVNNFNPSKVQESIIKGSSNMQNVNKTIKILNNYPNIISNIDWENFKPTKESMDQGYEIIKDKNRDELFSEELNQDNPIEKMSNSLQSAILITFIMYFVFVYAICFPNDYLLIKEVVEDKVSIVAQMLINTQQQENEEILENENTSVKDNLYIIIKELFRILKDTKDVIDVLKWLLLSSRKVTKEKTTVRKDKKINSKIEATLKAEDQVNIIEKRKKWTRVYYYNPETDKIQKGWILTRYLKKNK